MKQDWKQMWECMGSKTISRRNGQVHMQLLVVFSFFYPFSSTSTVLLDGSPLELLPLALSPFISKASPPFGISGLISIFLPLLQVCKGFYFNFKCWKFLEYHNQGIGPRQAGKTWLFVAFGNLLNLSVTKSAYEKSYISINR